MKSKHLRAQHRRWRHSHGAPYRAWLRAVASSNWNGFGRGEISIGAERVMRLKGMCKGMIINGST